MWIPDPELCPRAIRESIERYGEHGVPPGDFLLAVLENDLTEAIGRADHINGPAIHHIVAYCYNRIPSTCWGSKKRVDAWIAEHKARREAQS